MRSCVRGSMRTGSVLTTWIGFAGLTVSCVRGVVLAERRAPDRRWRCAGCDRRVSATAGTIFHGTRTPLTVWAAAVISDSGFDGTSYAVATGWV